MGLDLDKLVADAELCVRCGLCTSVCPTYQIFRSEIQGPRGRVLLYADYAQGLVPESEAKLVLEAAYDCLDCRACQSVCPNGVKPGEAALDARVALQGGRPKDRLTALALSFFYSPLLIDLANVLIVLYQRSGLQRWLRRSRLLERLGLSRLAFAESLLPERVAPALRLFGPKKLSPEGETRGRVAFFLGCVMNLVFSEASRATVEVIRAVGYEVVIPRETTCCGAPHIEEGDLEGFERLAKRNIDHYAELDADFIVTDCAACAAELKKYARHFADDPEYRDKAERVSKRVRLFSEFLEAAGLPESIRFPFPTTHQHACHACHAQGVKEAPEFILDRVADFAPLAGSTECCGSAGVYNLTHTETSMRILEKKMARVAETGAEVLTVENPGCLLQLGLGARRFGPSVEVKHLSQVVWEGLRKAADDRASI